MQGRNKSSCPGGKSDTTQPCSRSPAAAAAMPVRVNNTTVGASHDEGWYMQGGRAAAVRCRSAVAAEALPSSCRQSRLSMLGYQVVQQSHAATGQVGGGACCCVLGKLLCCR